MENNFTYKWKRLFEESRTKAHVMLTLEQAQELLHDAELAILEAKVDAHKEAMESANKMLDSLNNTMI